MVAKFIFGLFTTLTYFFIIEVIVSLLLWIILGLFNTIFKMTSKITFNVKSLIFLPLILIRNSNKKGV